MRWSLQSIPVRIRSRRNLPKGLPPMVFSLHPNTFSTPNLLVQNNHLLWFVIHCNPNMINHAWSINFTQYYCLARLHIFQAGASFSGRAKMACCHSTFPFSPLLFSALIALLFPLVRYGSVPIPPGSHIIFSP